MEISELKAELERLHTASFGWALSCCHQNRSDAEEVLQAVYLKILQGKATYRGESKLQTWLFAVIRKHHQREAQAVIAEFESIVSPSRSVELESEPPGGRGSYAGSNRVSVLLQWAQVEGGLFEVRVFCPG